MTAGGPRRRCAGEQRFRFLAESIPHLVWTCRPDGVVDYASPRLLEYLGIAADEPLMPAWTEAIHPEDRLAALDAWRRTVGDGTEYHVEYRLRGGDGAYRWFLGHALPERDESGRVVGWYGTCTDIDSRSRARQEIVRLNRDLRARVDELETLLETIPIGIALSEDSACARIRANSVLERLLETAPGSNTSLSAPEDQRPGHFHFRRDGRDIAPDDLPMQVAAREGRPVVGEAVEAVFADGRTRILYGNAAPLFDEDGRPRGAIGAFMDVTERRRVEAALADSEERMRLAVQATGLGLFDRDLASGTLRWSAHTKAIFGLPDDYPITYERFLTLVHPEDRDRVRVLIERALHPQVGGDYDVEYRCVWDDGTVRWVQGKGRVIFEVCDGARRPVRFVGTIQDITARKDAEAQLQEAKEAAETASLAKDRFLAVLSHELRTPLAPVVTAVALLEMTQGLPPEAQEYLAMIRRNIALETRLIDDLLDLSRVISGKFRLDRRPTHVNDLVEHVLDILDGEVHDKGLTVETTLARPARPGGRSPGAAAAGGLEPGAERGEVHAGRRHDRGGDAVDGRGSGRGGSPRHRQGDQPRGAAVDLQRFRAGRPGDHAAVRRPGTGLVDRQGGGGPPRRDDPGGQRRAGPRLVVRRGAPAGPPARESARRRPGPAGRRAARADPRPAGRGSRRYRPGDGPAARAPPATRSRGPTASPRGCAWRRPSPLISS